MEVKIDDYGRIVIPKKVRDRLGIEPGTVLEMSVETEGADGGSITLRFKGKRPALQWKGELLVHTGTLSEGGFDVTEQLRTERVDQGRRHAGMGE